MDATLKNALRLERDLLPEELIAKKIYEKCTALKISKFRTKEEKQVLMMIGVNLGLDVDLKTLKLLYLGGKQIAERTISVREAEVMSRARTREAAIFEAQIETAKLMGKEKYLAKRPALGNNKSKVSMPYSKFGFAPSFEMEINNACLMEEAAKARHRAYDVNEILNFGATEVTRKNTELCVKGKVGSTTKEEVREYISSRLIDNEYSFEAEVYPQVEMTRCVVTKGRNFLVQGEVKCSDVVDLFGKKAIVDGVYLLSVLDANGITVAEGVFSAPGVGQADLTKVGFVNGYTFQAVCVTDTPEEIDPTGIYTCVASPVNVWAIEI